ncbi:MAG: class I SAM-dependent methyltransferase [Bacteroidetes bacterium]|nr:class I SAM-dependent methyltransferase [Bacteroidota bacterium]
MADIVDPSQFYSGSIAHLYEALVADLPDPETSKRFVSKYGTPALELACGAGHPMLDLIESGLEVHGLDSSQDMLDLCLEKARVRGLRPIVFCQRMQDLDVPYRYRSCYLAGESFCLIDQLDDAQQAIDAVFRHLEPGGRFLVPVFRPELVDQPSSKRTATRADETVISIQSLSQTEDIKKQIVTTQLVFEIEESRVVVDTVQRDWIVRWYTVQQLTEMLCRAGFEIERIAGQDGKAVEPGGTTFLAIARKPSR